MDAEEEAEAAMVARRKREKEGEERGKKKRGARGASGRPCGEKWLSESRLSGHGGGNQKEGAEERPVKAANAPSPPFNGPRTLVIVSPGRVI